jgi:hypothetical protein
VCSFLPTLGAATAGELVRAALRLRGVSDEATIVAWLPLLFALGAAHYSARYAPPRSPPPPPQRRGIVGRLARLWVATGAFWLLACVGLVQHGSLSTMGPNGASETVRLRDCFKHIYNSPVWRDLPSFFSGVRTDWHESNWQETVLTRSHRVLQPCRTYRLRVPASRVPYIPEAQGSLPRVGRHDTCARCTCTSLGRAVRTAAYRGTTGKRPSAARHRPWT